mmetsp:Transcript_25133/g.82441  ORF Transcript_25133/g.82441 Transcript_25133/m.82441 type:complete len:260 (+) Transcript_25133:1947-2726(+)
MSKHEHGDQELYEPKRVCIGEVAHVLQEPPEPEEAVELEELEKQEVSAPFERVKGVDDFVEGDGSKQVNREPPVQVVSGAELRLEDDLTALIHVTSAESEHDIHREENVHKDIAHNEKLRIALLSRLLVTLVVHLKREGPRREDCNVQRKADDEGVPQSFGLAQRVQNVRVPTLRLAPLECNRVFIVVVHHLRHIVTVPFSRHENLADGFAPPRLDHRLHKARREGATLPLWFDSAPLFAFCGCVAAPYPPLVRLACDR